MSRGERERVASTLVFMDLAFGDDTAERNERRLRWERRKGKRTMK